MEISLILIGGFMAWFGWMFYQQQKVSSREIGRFQAGEEDIYKEATKQLDSILTTLGEKRTKKSKQTLGYHASKSEKELAAKLKDAGLESAAEQGKFILVRIGSLVGGVLVGLVGYLFLPTYYATIVCLMSVGGGVAAPLIWLKGKAYKRGEEIRRELPLILDLTNLGTSAGWDVSASFERVVEALNVEFPGHPLIKELNRARLLAANGSTWPEALKRVSNKIGDDSVRRTALALGQAITQGGDRTRQLEAIAEDAQRAYYTELDKRLATLPVKALLVTLMVLVAYFIILLAPAAVQVKNTLFKGL